MKNGREKKFSLIIVFFSLSAIHKTSVCKFKISLPWYIGLQKNIKRTIILLIHSTCIEPTMFKVDSCLNYFFIYNVESLDMIFIISFTLDKYTFFPGYCISIIMLIKVEFNLIQWILKDKSFLRHRFLTRITTQCKKICCVHAESECSKMLWKQYDWKERFKP